MASNRMIIYTDYSPKDWTFTETNCSHITNSEDVLLMEDIGYIIVIPIICVIGIILNLLNVIVLFRKPLNDSLIHTYLGIISFTDLVTLALVSPIGVARCSSCHNLNVSAVIYEIYIYMPLANASASTSIWMTTVVTMERCVMVRRSVPSKTESVMRAWIWLACMASAVIVINLPYFFCYRIRDKRVVLTHFGAGSGFEVYSWIRVTLIGYLPTILIIVFNALLLQSVWKANKRRAAMLKNSIDYQKVKSQIRLSVLLIAVSLIFVLCHMPEFFSHPGIIRTLRGPCGYLMDGTKIHKFIANVLEMLSYTYHFLLYMTCNNQFRRCFIKMWPVSFLACRRNRVHIDVPLNSATPSAS